MKRKFLKRFLLVTAILLIIPLLIAGVFHAWEYASGKKYVEYLEAHSETVPLDSSFTFSTIGPDIEKSKLILAGEIHGFHEPQVFDVEFFKYLHKEHGVRYYLAEMDYLQASMVNEYLETGDDNTLGRALKNWVVAQGRENKDYYDKYRAFYRFYQDLPEEEKFQFIGIDRLRDRPLLLDFLQAITQKELHWASDENETGNLESTNADKITRLDPKDFGAMAALVDSAKLNYQDDPDSLFILTHLSTNLNYIADKVNREEVMFQNFRKLYGTYEMEDETIYGYFGLFHVFQYRVNGSHPLASRVRQSDLGLEDQILSVNLMMNDSYMVMPSSQLPPFMRDEGSYTRMPVTADNLLTMYIVGVKDFKRMTPEYHKSLVKMDGDNNPYAGSSRLNKTIQVLPVSDVFKMTDRGEQYVQYTLFIRNSDWAAPGEE